ncbi:MAG: twin-arginine translocase subunit TatC [Rikenellaceae bacterium]
MAESLDQDTGVTLGTFWDHLDALRGTIIRIIGGIVLFAVVAFFFKDQLFSMVLAPQSDDFITYRMVDRVSESFLELTNEWLGDDSLDVGGEALLGVEPFRVKLISTQLSGQFITHIQVSIYAGLLVVFPYLLYELFRFVSPALYSNERRYALRIVSSSYIMFMLGMALSYFLIFPLTFRFLGTYQVSGVVENQIVLDSYIGTMMMLNLMMGIVFEIPILALLFARMGFISAQFMSRFRRHAIVILLIISAIITPTSDVVTLLLVALPMYLLYELSILLVRLTGRSRH